ncbi:hypothetical protein [Oscillatoria nigro-viridis]|uniref:hypothetical protein n=1 Tax=Phormidium nigroviride TaxID=482564 RepID=UPI00030FF0BD|nr:hypothetical protein [Oscillatoria nigro-viridis]
MTRASHKYFSSWWYYSTLIVIDCAAADRVVLTALALDGGAAKTVLKPCRLLVSSWCALKNRIFSAWLRVQRPQVQYCRMPAKRTIDPSIKQEQGCNHP